MMPKNLRIINLQRKIQKNWLLNKIDKCSSTLGSTFVTITTSEDIVFFPENFFSWLRLFEHVTPVTKKSSDE